MRKNYKAFKFNGDSDSFSDILNVTLDDDFYEECIRGDREIMVDKIPGRDIPYFYEVDDEVIEFDLNFAFQIPVTKDRIKDITRKLISHKTYKELTFGEYENGSYVAKTPIYNCIFTGASDFSYVQQSSSVNNFQVESSSTIQATDYIKAVYTLNYVKTDGETETYPKTGGTILNGEDVITGITDFDDLRVGQTVAFNGTNFATVTEIDTEAETITVTPASSSEKTGTFNFIDFKRVSVSDVDNIVPGMLITGTGIASDTFVESIYDITNKVVSMTKNSTSALVGSTTLTFYQLDKLVVNVTNLAVNQRITAGSATINGKIIQAVGTGQITIFPSPTTFIPQASPENATITNSFYPTGSTTLNFTAGTYYDLKVGNFIEARGSSSNTLYGEITAVTSTSVTVNVLSSYSNYVDLVEPDIYVTYISSDNGFIGYFVLHATCDRPYGYNDITATATDTDVLTVVNTGDIEFYPNLVITNTNTGTVQTDKYIRVKNNTNQSSITFSSLASGEVVTINANLQTITSTGGSTAIYPRWQRDNFYLNIGSNSLQFSYSTDAVTWTDYNMTVVVSGEAPVYIYEAE